MAIKNDTRNLEQRNLVAPPRVNPSCLSQVYIECEDSAIKQGVHFYLLKGYNIAAENEFQCIYVKTTNDGDFGHWSIALNANGPIVFRVVEGATNEVTPDQDFFNNRRMSANTTATKWLNNQIAATGGIDIVGDLILGKTGTFFATSLGGDVGNREAVIFKANTLYCFEAQAAEADVDVNFTLEFYEYTDRY